MLRYVKLTDEMMSALASAVDKTETGALKIAYCLLAAKLAGSLADEAESGERIADRFMYHALRTLIEGAAETETATGVKARDFLAQYEKGKAEQKAGDSQPDALAALTPEQRAALAATALSALSSSMKH